MNLAREAVYGRWDRGRRQVVDPEQRGRVGAIGHRYVDRGRDGIGVSRRRHAKVGTRRRKNRRQRIRGQGQQHVVGGIGHGRGDASAEGPGRIHRAEHARSPTSRREQRIGAVERIGAPERRQPQRACQRGSSGHVDAVRVGALDFGEIGRAGVEGQVAVDRQRARRVAGRERPAIEHCRRNHARAAEQRAGRHRHTGGGRDRAVHDQRTGVDRRCAGIAVGSGQGERARADLGERALAIGAEIAAEDGARVVSTRRQHHTRVEPHSRSRRTGERADRLAGFQSEPRADAGQADGRRGRQGAGPDNAELRAVGDVDRG